MPQTSWYRVRADPTDVAPGAGRSCRSSSTISSWRTLVDFARWQATAERRPARSAWSSSCWSWRLAGLDPVAAHPATSTSSSPSTGALSVGEDSRKAADEYVKRATQCPRPASQRGSAYLDVRRGRARRRSRPTSRNASTPRRPTTRRPTWPRAIEVAAAADRRRSTSPRSSLITDGNPTGGDALKAALRMPTSPSRPSLCSRPGPTRKCRSRPSTPPRRSCRARRSTSRSSSTRTTRTRGRSRSTGVAYLKVNEKDRRQALQDQERGEPLQVPARRSRPGAARLSSPSDDQEVSRPIRCWITTARSAWSTRRGSLENPA